MTLRSCTALLFATVAVFTAASAHAQALLADKKDLTGFAARKMIEACIAEAARDRYPIAIAVVDFRRLSDLVSGDGRRDRQHRRNRAAQSENRRQVPQLDGRAL